MGFSVQLLVLNLSFSGAQAWITIAAIPICIILIFLAVWSVKNEIGWLQILFDVGIIAGIAYFGVKLWRIWAKDTEAIYAIDQKSLTIFGNGTPSRKTANYQLEFQLYCWFVRSSFQ